MLEFVGDSFLNADRLHRVQVTFVKIQLAPSKDGLLVDFANDLIMWQTHAQKSNECCLTGAAQKQATEMAPCEGLQYGVCVSFRINQGVFRESRRSWASSFVMS